jgi:MscS family membrane protein
MLEKTFYMNTISDWVVACLIIIFSVVVAKVFFKSLKLIFESKVKENNLKVDDILVTSIEKPLTFFIILFGLWFGIKTLNLPDALIAYLDKAYYFLFIIAIAWFFTRLTTETTEIYLKPIVDKTETNLDNQLLPILSKGAKLIIWILAILIGLDNAGYDVGALLAGLGLGGLAFAMAAKDTISNFFGSFVIFSDKPFMQGDVVKVSGVSGTIQEVGIRSTRIKTFDNRIVTIPNSNVANTAIENISSEPSRKVAMTLGLTYDTSLDKIEKAKEILNNIVDSHDNIDDSRTIYFDSFGDFALNLKFTYYIKKVDGSMDVSGTKDSVNMQILKEFNENAIEFAFPTQTIHNLP